jgi:hypothetical protein
MRLRLNSQFTTCPNCNNSYRKSVNQTEKRCPACGIIYEKFWQQQAKRKHPEPIREEYLIPNSRPPRNVFNFYNLISYGYLLLFGVILIFERKATNLGDNQHITALDKILFAPIAFNSVINGLKTGSMQSEYGTKYRSKDPISFWTQLIVELLIGIIALCWGIAEI